MARAKTVVLYSIAPFHKPAPATLGWQSTDAGSHTYESGKRWIPFYFGNDARRLQVLFKGEGCLIFTDGNVWGGAGGDLISIEHDATGNCYKP